MYADRQKPEEEMPEIQDMEQSLHDVIGIQSVSIDIRYPEDQQPMFIINFPGIGKVPFFPSEDFHGKEQFLVTISFRTELNIQEFEREIRKIIAKKPYFINIKRAIDHAQSLEMEMTKTCAEELYDVDTYGNIDEALIAKYGGIQTMIEFLFETFLRERVTTIRPEENN